jgi:hypothetical protein
MGKSLKSRFKKAFNKIPAVSLAKKAKAMFKPEDDMGEDPRGLAAKQLVKKSAIRQGGGGQVNFTTEELV